MQLHAWIRRGILGLMLVWAVGIPGGTRPALRFAPHRHPPLRVHQRHTDGTADAYNWSGYAVEGAAGSVTDVKGSWTVPTASCSGTPNGYASFWIGIDGFASNTVEQIGTDADCVSLTGVSNTPTYYAWFEFYPHPAYLINLPSGVSPGHVMSAEVQYASRNGFFTATLTDTTTGHTFSISGIVRGAQRSSAEWIAEAPADADGVLPLADFKAVAFGPRNQATVSGLSGTTIGTFIGHNNPWQITMVSEKAPHAVKAQPGSLSTTDHSSFTDTWVTEGP